MLVIFIPHSCRPTQPRLAKKVNEIGFDGYCALVAPAQQRRLEAAPDGAVERGYLNLKKAVCCVPSVRRTVSW